MVHETYPSAVEGTLLHKALTYSINHEEGLRCFLEDGKVELRSNEIERRVKSFVMSRRNFLFSYTEGGARASEAVYSIVESAKMNNLKPYEYIKYILDEMKGKRLTDDLFEKLMPWANELPRTVRLKNRGTSYWLSLFNLYYISVF